MPTRLSLAASILCLVPIAATAQAPDWPASIVCSLGDATICTPSGCHVADLDTLDVPQLIRLDLEHGVMNAVTPQHSGRRSHFEIIESGESTLVLQGYENGRAFSAVLNEPGTLAISASTESTNFSVFARCTDLKLVTDVGN